MPRAKPTRNPWMLHLARYKASHPKESLKTCMQKASKTYYRGQLSPQDESEISEAISKRIEILKNIYKGPSLIKKLIQETNIHTPNFSISFEEDTRTKYHIKAVIMSKQSLNIDAFFDSA